MKTVKMIFPQDMYYNLDILYKGGEEVDVPEDMVGRWMKRGGQLVSEMESEVVQEAVHEEEELVESEEPEHDEKEAPRKYKGHSKRRR